jgi:hypothetical protein
MKELEKQRAEQKASAESLKSKLLSLKKHSDRKTHKRKSEQASSSLT